MKQPIQPLEEDEHGTMRFKKNKLVEYLLDHGGLDMNDLAIAEAKENFTREDQEQFAQLIGYSLDGFGTLSYATDETYETAYKMANERKTEIEARNEYLEETLKTVREGLRTIVPDLFGVHPADLKV